MGAPSRVKSWAPAPGSEGHHGAVGAQELGPGSSHRWCQPCSTRCLFSQVFDTGTKTRRVWPGLVHSTSLHGLLCSSPELLFGTRTVPGARVGTARPFATAQEATPDPRCQGTTGAIAPLGAPGHRGSEGLRFCISRGCQHSDVPCKLQAGPGSSGGCSSAGDTAPAPARGVVTGGAAPAGSPKRHQPSLPRAQAALCLWPGSDGTKGHRPHGFSTGAQGACIPSAF